MVEVLLDLSVVLVDDPTDVVDVLVVLASVEVPPVVVELVVVQRVVVVGAPLVLELLVDSSDVVVVLDDPVDVVDFPVISMLTKIANLPMFDSKWKKKLS